VLADVPFTGILGEYLDKLSKLKAVKGDETGGSHRCFAAAAQEARTVKDKGGKREREV
jgi:hypothetical protein